MPEYQAETNGSFEFDALKGYANKGALVFIGGLMSAVTFLIINWAVSPNKEEIRTMNKETVDHVLGIVKGMILTEDRVLAILSKNESWPQERDRFGDRITGLLDSDKALREDDNQIRQRLDALERVDHARDIELEKIKADIRFLQEGKRASGANSDP